MRKPSFVAFRMAQKINLIPDGHTLSPRGRLAWLQRLMWRSLEKMGALQQEHREETEIVRLPMDGETIFYRIMEQVDGLYDIDRPPTEVLIGKNNLAELMHCPEIRDCPGTFTIDAQPEMRQAFDTPRGPPKIVRRIFNIPIRVVPQMDGILVLDL